MGEWARPDDFSLVFRLTSSEYVDKFIDKGSIKFNTPQSWIDYAKEHGTGRGDGYEGTIAFCDVTDYERVFQLYEKYHSNNILIRDSRPLITGINGQRLLLKDKRSLQLPCFCVYIMKHSLFHCPNRTGKQRLSAEIPGSYFRDFSDNSSPEEISNLPLEKQPALIIIRDFDEFKRRLYNSLRKLGLKDTEILTDIVSYYNFEQQESYGEKDFERKYPYELFIKSTRFKEQSEARVIIKTTKVEIIKYLYNNAIELGCMKDIAEVYKGYLYNGVEVEMTMNIYEKSTSEIIR